MWMHRCDLVNLAIPSPQHLPSSSVCFQLAVPVSLCCPPSQHWAASFHLLAGYWPACRIAAVRVTVTLTGKQNENAANVQSTPHACKKDKRVGNYPVINLGWRWDPELQALFLVMLMAAVASLQLGGQYPLHTCEGGVAVETALFNGRVPPVC